MTKNNFVVEVTFNVENEKELESVFIEILPKRSKIVIIGSAFYLQPHSLPQKDLSKKLKN